MTLGTDQNPELNQLSSTSRRMLELEQAVFVEWEKRVRERVKEAGGLSHPILLNTMPTFFENLVQTITQPYPRASAESGNNIASEHGGERARLTHYNPQAVISEYQILRWTIFDTMKQHGVMLNEAEVACINASIDGSIAEAVTSYALVQSMLRERFVAALTHDLRNPLASASAAAELIRHTTDSPKLRDLADRIIDNNNRMDRMIQDLLDAVVFQAGERPSLELSSFDMLELANEVRDQFSALHGHRFHVTGVPVTGWWSREAIKRALENILGNAVKYGTPDTPVRIVITTHNQRVLLAVHNEGDPIPQEQLESVFQVFRRTEAARTGKKRGWGIGLPYVRSIAEGHGGSVNVDSSAELGTTLQMDIPIDSRPYQDAPVTPDA
ncbi:MAG TPA: HAMP domain-containing sensor histidine kinase [Noviherbaspirillum sp.]|uniref:sensor histidine kinase n=1 Tax=Noviherbaspirillum sp. TaxID=1926288 RepID=UPI002DDD8A43|nr:HAMP domain-containing sensor histidine kinase [Noviherbaspirillum sp.]HEV2610267.1 HAMP domain-containing sensor histidine kinase [Noviherbaspirillum sp.]